MSNFSEEKIDQIIKNAVKVSIYLTSLCADEKGIVDCREFVITLEMAYLEAKRVLEMVQIKNLTGSAVEETMKIFGE